MTVHGMGMQQQEQSSPHQQGLTTGLSGFAMVETELVDEDEDEVALLVTLGMVLV